MAIVCRQCGRSNPDRTQFCANPECGAYLAWDGDASATSTWQQAAAPGASQPPPGPAAGQHAAAALTLSDPTLSVEPGQSVTTTVSVHNGGSQVEQFVVSVSGPAAPWSTVEPATMSVFPGQQGECTVRFAPPRTSGTPAGQAWFSVHAASTVHPGLVAAGNGTLDIRAFRELSATLVPQNTAGRLRSTHRVEVTNAGNVIEPIQVQANDRDGRMRFSVVAGEVPIAPGRGAVEIGVRPPLRLVGRPRSHPFQVSVVPRPPVPPIRLDGGREALPLMSRWVPVFVGVLALLVGAGFGAARVLPPLLRTSGPTQTTTAPTTLAPVPPPNPTPTASPTPPPSPSPSPTPARSRTRSPSPSPSTSPPPPIYKQGALNIPQTWTVDLDELVIGSSPEIDMWFEAVTATERYITPRGGLVAKLAQTDNPLARCLSAALTPNRIPIPGLTAGDVVCARTNRGRLAVMTIKAPVGPSPGTLSVDVITYEP